MREAVAARRRQEFGAALKILRRLGAERPRDAQVAYQHAWTLDVRGREREAIPYYSKAISCGLKDVDLRDALLGLGSSLRCVGRAKESVAVLERAARRFPGHAPLKAFLALSYHADGRNGKAMRCLGSLLLDSRALRQMKPYRKVLAAYFLKGNQGNVRRLRNRFRRARPSDCACSRAGFPRSRGTLAA